VPCSGTARDPLRVVASAGVARCGFNRNLFGAHYMTIVTIGSPQRGGEHVLGQGSSRISVVFGIPSPVGLVGFVRLGAPYRWPCSGWSRSPPRARSRVPAAGGK
jgi:hypothetical protein